MLYYKKIVEICLGGFDVPMGFAHKDRMYKLYEYVYDTVTALYIVNDDKVIIYSKICEQGWQASKDDNMVLLNDDTNLSFKKVLTKKEINDLMFVDNI